MRKPYRSFVTVSAPERVEGWGLYRTIVDCRFTVWMACTHEFIPASKTYDFELFINYVSEIPCFCFGSKEQAIEFCKTKSNRYPIDFQLKGLKWRPQYWYATILEQYINIKQWMQELNY